MEKKICLISASSLALALAMSHVALAQTVEPAPGAPAAVDDTAVEEVVVTGTLLRGVAPVGTNVVGLSREDVTATGATSANQVLARIPQITSSFNQTPALSQAGAAVTITRPNIRNLGGGGGNTTLVLVDGHRIASAGVLQTAPDPDVVPPGLLERVEVVPDGGSSIYGSDAVGGVINFITRKRFSGVEASARYGVADAYETRDANLTAGRDWGTGSAFISYAYASHDALFGRDRDYVKQISPQTGSCAPGTVTVTRSGTATTYALPGRVAGTSTSCDFTDNATVYPKEVRHSVFLGVVQDLSDRLSLDTRGFFTRRTSDLYVDFNSSSGFNSLAQSGSIDSTNPYYVAIAPDPGSQTVNFSYAGVFDNKGVTTLDEWGLTPNLTADLGKGWQLRVLGNIGGSITDAHSPSVNTTNQAAALAGTTTATALNPYDLGATNQAVLNTILQDSYGKVRQDMQNARAIADGALFALPGGDVRLAVGAEVMHEKYRARVGDKTAAGVDVGTNSSATRTVKSVFGEVSIPLVGSGNAMPGLQSLTVTASGRYDDYSDFGDTFNPKVGATWKPVDWVSVRGNWGTSFNAPSLADASGAIDTAVQGLPVSVFRAADSTLADFLRPEIILAGGNPDLKPQEATTYSFGADVKPPIAPGLTLSATYYNVDFTNQISLVPFFSPAVFTSLYSNYVILNPTLAQVQAAAAGITRQTGIPYAALFANGAQPYALIDARRRNLGSVKQDGVDFNASYERSTSFGWINASIGGSYILGRKSKAVAGAAYNNDLEVPGQSRLSLVSTLGARMGAWNGSVTLSHSQGYDISPALGTQTHVKSYDTVDAFVGYDLNGEGLLKDVSLTLNVSNLFDKDPPFYNQDPGYTNGATLGRLVQVGIHKTF